jgi:hypothetical protein
MVPRRSAGGLLGILAASILGHAAADSDAAPRESQPPRRQPDGVEIFLVAKDTVDGVEWTLLYAPVAKIFCVRPADQALHAENSLEIPQDHMEQIAQERGTCIPRKTAQKISKGLLKADYPDLTFILIKDMQDNASYVLRMRELVAWAKPMLAQLVQQLKEEQANEPAKDAQTPAADVPGDLQDRAKDPTPPGETAG